MQLVILTGSGVSAESGIPTYRGDAGLWENYKIEQICDITTWKQSIPMVHGFYNAQRSRLPQYTPNQAHAMIQTWQQRYNAAVFTQNIDDLHERAGTEVVHLHGRLVDMQCTACGFTWEIRYRSWDHTQERCPNPKRPCGCRKGVKPGVVFFGERAPNYPTFQKTIAGLGRDSTIVVIGTSGVVVPIHQMIQHLPCRKILNNLTPGAIGMESAFQHQFMMPATQGVQEVDRLLQTLA